MLRSCAKLGFCLFFSFVFFSIFSPVLKAELISKDDIMAMTLTKLEDSPQAMQLAQNTAQPQEGLAQPSQETAEPAPGDIDYRHRLKELVTLEEEEGVGLAIDSYVRYMPSRSLYTQDGKISIVDSATEVSYDFKLMNKLPIELSIDTQYISLNDKESMPISLPAKLTGMGFGVQATLPFFNVDKTYFRMKVEPTYNSDDWNVNNGTFRLPGQAFLIYQPNEKWTLVGGIAVYPHSPGNSILPIAGFIYKPNDKLLFNIIPTRPTISYAFTDRITGFLEGGMSSPDFRVNLDGYKGAILTYNEMHAGAGLKINLTKNIDASLSAGRMFNRYLEYADSLGKIDIKNDYYSEFRVEASL